MVTREFEIVNVKGLHARASAKFVEVVEDFDARAEVEKDGMRVSGDSIMGLLMLAASCGTSIKVTTSGSEADALADALGALIADTFGEGNCTTRSAKSPAEAGLFFGSPVLSGSEPAFRPGNHRTRGRSCGRASQLRHISSEAGRDGISYPPGRRAARS